ncbi:glycoside hydrolase family 25 protein [Frankia sp. Mgl5]|uniref:glycoside hydrolase family 25 protein n=1 Tax=Frankia sp. Mgl5 TaxID=2933793 RepID=UPI00201073C2|nr:glycoside hydrolase family 25 protein [Frankia sp. Mgl5]MCK9929311.1 glycoside hydrolase family 25 protein [Frankia sp. Mgl5]
MDFADISSYQAGADLAAYARAGHDRILIKASQGTGYANPHFGGWWRSAGQAGLARGAYHYATPSTGSTGQAEADQFDRTLRAAGGLGPRDWVCLDVEDPKERGPAAAKHAAAFCVRMVELGYAGGVIYSGTWYLQPAGLKAGDLPARWQWLHLANYTSTPDEALPLPSGWSRQQVLARQYSETASQPGIPGKSDRNRILREWLPASAAAALEEDDMPSADEVADAVLTRLSTQMRALVTTDPDTQQQERMADVRLAGIGDAIGLLVLRSSFGMRRDAALGAALTELLGADHPAAAALAQASAPPRVTVAELVALAPQVTPADAALVVAAYATRLVPPTPPKETTP